MNNQNNKAIIQKWSTTLLGVALAIGGFIFIIISIKSWGYAAIQIEWQTASELDTVGFNILRAETEDGPFEQVNQQLIPPAADPLTGEDYVFTDTQAKTGRTYYYFLEEIEATGGRNQHGPINQEAGYTNWLN